MKIETPASAVSPPAAPLLASTVVLAVALATVAPLLADPTPLSAVLSEDSGGGETMGRSRVRLAHLSPDAPVVDVCVDGAQVFSNLSYSDITGYAVVPAGSHRVVVEPTQSGCRGPFLIDEMVSLSADAFYTVAATDVLASITAIVLLDDNADPIAGNGHLRFFHGAADAPAIDLAVTNGPVLFANVGFQEASAPSPIAAGTYDLEVRMAGTGSVVLFLPGTVVGDGDVVTAWAIGLAADGAADRTLYLNESRFRVEVTWTDFNGNSGPGLLSPLRTEDTGVFYFFDSANLELTVKVLDATILNNAFWVFFGSLTNVQFELVVTDTADGSVRTYVNALGEFASVGDISAFPQ